MKLQSAFRGLNGRAGLLGQSGGKISGDDRRKVGIAPLNRCAAVDQTKCRNRERLADRYGVIELQRGDLVAFGIKQAEHLGRIIELGRSGMDVDEIDAVERAKIVDRGLKIIGDIRHAKPKLGSERRIVESDRVCAADRLQTPVKFKNGALAGHGISVDVVLSRSADRPKKIKCLTIGCRCRIGGAKHVHGRIDIARAEDERRLASGIGAVRRVDRQPGAVERGAVNIKTAALSLCAVRQSPGRGLT